MKTNRKYTIISLFGSLMVAALFVSLFSVGTSFLFGDDVSPDQKEFMLLGKYWTMGDLPYVSFFCHTGPFTFIPFALGYLINVNYGVFIIQVLLLLINILIVDRILLKENNRKEKFMTLSLFLLSLAILYSWGASAEEFILPFLLIATVMQYKWLVNAVSNNEFHHNSYVSLYYGVVLSICLFSRLTNGLGVCVGYAVLMGSLMIYHQWRNLIHNISFFIIGFILFSSLFIIYFYCKNGLNEMLYGTLWFNMEYFNNSTKELALSFTNMKLFYVFIIPIIISFGSIFIKERRLIGVYILLSSTGVLWWIIRSFCFDHYFIIQIPIFVVSIAELFSLLPLISKRKRTTAQAIFGLCTLFILIFFTRHAYDHGRFRYSPFQERYSKAQKAIDNIPKSERNAFIAWEMNANLYLLNDIKPCYNNFVHQEWHMQNGPSIRPRIINAFESCKAKWIMAKVDTNYRISDDKIRKIVEYHYVERCHWEEYSRHFALYRLRE